MEYLTWIVEGEFNGREVHYDGLVIPKKETLWMNDLIERLTTYGVNENGEHLSFALPKERIEEIYRELESRQPYKVNIRNVPKEQLDIFRMAFEGDEHYNSKVYSDMISGMEAYTTGVSKLIEGTIHERVITNQNHGIEIIRKHFGLDKSYNALLGYFIFGSKNEKEMEDIEGEIFEIMRILRSVSF